MKKILVLVVMISLGLNLGLGVRFWKESRDISRPGNNLEFCEPVDQSGPGRQDGSGGGRDGSFWRGVMERRLAHVSDRLGLDPEQAEAFKKTHQEAAVGFLAQREKVQAARRQLMEATLGTDLEVGALRHLIAEVGRQQAKLDSMVTETMLQEMEILDEEQRREYMRILPINRFGNRNSGPGHKAERGGGRRRH